jgi:CIC family chloride channel protein
MVYCEAVTRPEPSSPNFLLRWAIQAVVAGSLGAVVVRAFFLSVSFLLELWTRIGAPPVLVATGAAVAVGALVYTIAPGAAGEGIPTYLLSVRAQRRALSVRDSFFKFPAAVITLGCFGSGGAVGPMGRVVAGLSQWITRGLRRVLPRLFADHEQHHAHYHAPKTAAISGMAAAVAAIFGAPIAGAVFAVEVIQTDQLRYHQIFPAALAAGTAVIVAELFGWAPLVNVSAPPFSIDAALLIPIVAIGILSGGMGIAYTSLYRFVADTLGRDLRRRRIPRLLVGMVGSALIGIAVNPLLYGTGDGLYDALLTGTIHHITIGVLPMVSSPALILMVLIIGKIVGNCLTTGSGMSAGFTGPAALAGLAGGALVATLVGIPPGSTGYAVLLASGFSGMLASTMNTPLAGAILAVELFGTGYGLPGALSAMIAFQVARYSTIYDVALAKRPIT